MSQTTEFSKRVNKYKAFMPVVLADRTWPDNQLTQAPFWCSVDLRDGNQSLIEPMNLERKLKMFHLLVERGFKEIEVGFPSASETDFGFVRHLIENALIPEDVSIQVLTQARQNLIERTFESVKGAKNVIVHLYNSTSPTQREWVFNVDQKGCIDIAKQGANWVVEYAQKDTNTDWQFQYSPESYSQTEIDFAIQVCNEVQSVWRSHTQKPIIFNLPSTVEVTMPNVFADSIEYFCRQIDNRDELIISIHAHNDRGTGVAAAEMSVLAGADRIEGTLFGNGERTGNLDIVTMAMNMFSQGVDPKLDFSNINEMIQVAEYCNQLPVHPRHPYSGELVFTAFSGSHQDAIKKGMSKQSAEPVWRVPYLPIDPQDVGRNYESIIRVNSQSGKGGIAYLLEQDYGLKIPRAMQIDFSQKVQQHMDTTGKELSSQDIYQLFERSYLEKPESIALSAYHVQAKQGMEALEFHLQINGQNKSIIGLGNGPVDAFVHALNQNFGLDLEILDFQEHALNQGSDSKAIAYLKIATQGKTIHTAQVHQSIVDASLMAILKSVDSVLSGIQLATSQ
jgi:2-isopropylmalate synthase